MKSESDIPAAQADTHISHHFVAQLIYISKRARPDIQIAVSFLCTRVRGPATDEYKNLTRVMK